MANLSVKLQNIEVKKPELDNKTVDFLAEEIFNIKTNLDNFIYQQLSPTKQAAYIYISTLKNLIKKQIKIASLMQDTRQMSNAVKQGQEDSITKYADIVKKRNIQLNSFQELIRQATVATEKFSSELQFLRTGRKSQIVYLYQSQNANKIELYELDSIEDLINFKRNKYFPSLSLTREQINNNNKIVKKSLSEYAIGEKQAQLLNATYKEIIKRYNKWRYDYHSLVLWNMDTKKPSDRWEGMWLSQKGDLAEGYAYFGLKAKKANFSPVNHLPEQGIHNFMTIIQNVDAVSGLLQGDIETRQYSYAIKTLLASPQSIQEAILDAQQLLNTNKTDQKAFKDMMTRMKKEGRNTIKTFTQEQILLKQGLLKIAKQS